MTAPPQEDWVVVAKIVRPQGRRGEVLADLLTDFPERFAERRRLFLLAAKPKPGGAVAKEVALERYWLHQGRVVLKFAGVESISDAETLRGLEVAIPRAERAQLDEDSVYIADLIGCRLIDARSGAEVGEIVDVDRETTATALLVVNTASSGEVLVPFVKSYRPSLDLAAKRISMELPEGLLDLNAASQGGAE
jgi:16S rRNA processing protein RimM